MIPKEMVPQKIKKILNNGDYQVVYVMSEYKTGTDEVNEQCDAIEKIIKKYDDSAMLIGEAPCTKDLIRITDQDFKTVNTVSIVLIFIFFILLTARILKSAKNTAPMTFC